MRDDNQGERMEDEENKIPLKLCELLPEGFTLCHAYKPGKTIIWEDTLKEYSIEYNLAINSHIGVIGILENEIRFMYYTIADTKAGASGTKHFKHYELDKLAKFIEEVKNEQLLAWYTHYPTSNL
jgi:hypothetical protein